MCKYGLCHEHDGAGMCLEHMCLADTVLAPEGVQAAAGLFCCILTDLRHASDLEACCREDWQAFEKLTI